MATEHCPHGVLPARAGMAHFPVITLSLRDGSPCTRRDGPFLTPTLAIGYGFSLHAQGWPLVHRRDSGPCLVLPARAGMARLPACPSGLPRRSPCTRRDGPFRAYSSPKPLWFSLHAQGWPDDHQLPIGFLSVLPARAGMARYPSTAAWWSLGSPCTRRDGPNTKDGPKSLKRFSLHAQGWPGRQPYRDRFPSVLPARAGMAR